MPASERDPLLSHHSSAVRRSSLQRWRDSLSDSLDQNGCETALTLQCIIAGAADAASFSQTGTWVGFMTGNITQLTIAITDSLAIQPSPSASISRIWHSSSAVLGFVIGAFLATWIDSHYHGKHRGKLALTALMRAFIFATLVPFLALYGWGGWGGLIILFFMSLNMGSMAVCALKLGTTPYSTTVVFTSTLANLFSDPLLPLSLSKASMTRARSIGALIVGGACSQIVIIYSSRYFGGPSSALTATNTEKPIGSAFSIGMAAMFEVICAFAWLNAKSTSSA